MSTMRVQPVKRLHGEIQVSDDAVGLYNEFERARQVREKL